MKRLGYTRFVAQGGDWGAAVTEQMGVQAPPELLGIHTNMPAAVPAEIWQALPSRQPAARPLGRRKACVRAARLLLYTRPGLRPADGGRARRRSTGLRIHPSGSPPGSSTTTSLSYELIARVFDGTDRGPHARRRSRQHHALLADQHGDFLGASLLGEQASPFFASDGRQDPGCRERLSRRALPGPAELGGAGLSQAHPLQQARQRRPLRGLGTAEALSPKRFARASDRCANRTEPRASRRLRQST